MYELRNLNFNNFTRGLCDLIYTFVTGTMQYKVNGKLVLII